MGATIGLAEYDESGELPAPLALETDSGGGGGDRAPNEGAAEEAGVGVAGILAVVFACPEPRSMTRSHSVFTPKRFCT